MKDAFDTAGAVILGASFDDQAANAAFARKYDLNFPLLCDTDRKLGMLYGACDAPDAGFARRITYVINAEGVIQRAYPKVDPAVHAKQVLEDIAAQRAAAP